MRLPTEAARPVEHEPAADPRLLELAGPLVVARVEQVAVHVADDGDAAGAAVRGLVLEAQRIFDRPLAAADRGLEAGEQGIGEVAAEFRAPGILAGDAGRPHDDVGDLAGQARNGERRAVAYLDADDVAGRDPAQAGLDVVGLARMRWPLSSTLPVAWPRPRSWIASRMVKPGTRASMSSALRGA